MLTLFSVFLCVRSVSVVNSELHFSLHFRRPPLSHPLRRHPNLHAADIRETSAAHAPFQRKQPNLPLHKIVNSAVSPVPPTCHFSG